MAAPFRDGYYALAQAFAYPTPRLLAALAGAVSAFGDGSPGERYRAFVGEVDRLSLAEWEELYTRTFDLNPLVAPYVGFQAWGDGYRRGPFLAAMNRALREAGVDPLGELPDHIAPVLRYLANAPTPLPELLDVLLPAVDRMASSLKRAEPDNPYVNLFRAVQAFLALAAKDAVRGLEEAT